MKENLKMLTQEEVADLCCTSVEIVAMWREIGILKATRTGKRYMFSQKEIERFQKDYRGLNVSNKVKALESARIVNEIDF